MFIRPQEHVAQTSAVLRGSADKSLARPGRKKATATKLGIYSTYSPWSSVHFLTRCSNLFKRLKKNSESCPSNQVYAAGMTSTSDENWRPFNCFSAQRTGGSATGTNPRNRVGDQDIESTGRTASSWFQVPGEPGHCRARTRPPWWPLRGFSLQNGLQLHQQRWALLRVDSLALWKIVNEEDAVFIPKNRDENFSSGFLHSEFFGAGWAATPPLHWLLLCLRLIVI